MASFTGRNALITDSGGGIGKATAGDYLNLGGAQAVLCNINEPRFKKAKTEWRAKGTIFTHKVAVTDEPSVGWGFGGSLRVVSL